MDPRTILTRGVATGLRLSRGTADRVVSVAGPRLGKFTDKVVAKVRRHESPTTTTTTFVPSKRAADPAPDPAPHPTPDPQRVPETATKPSPSSVARNIGPQRPVAKPARASKPKSVPGAKLPPPRPNAS